MDFCRSCALLKCHFPRRPTKRKFYYAKIPPLWMTSPLPFTFPTPSISPPAFCKHNSKWILPLSSGLEFEALLEITATYSPGRGWWMPKWDLNVLKCGVLRWLGSPQKLTFPSRLNYQTFRLLYSLLMCFHPSDWTCQIQNCLNLNISFHVDCFLWTNFLPKPRVARPFVSQHSGFSCVESWLCYNIKQSVPSS